MNPLFFPTAFIDGLGGSEMVVIFLIVLLLFGGDKMPEFAKGLAKSIREFKKATSGVEEEFKRAMEDPPESAKTLPTIAPPAATVPQQQLEAPNMISEPEVSPTQIHDVTVVTQHPSSSEAGAAATHPVADTKPKPSHDPASGANTDWL